MSKSLIIAVDFDGTVVQHCYPDVGPDVPGASGVLREFVKRGHRLILWTMRSGIHLNEAKEWFAHRGIDLFGVNLNHEQKTWTDSPKAYAHMYVDDAAIGCPKVRIAGFSRPCVDWEKVAVLVLEHERELEERQRPS